MPGNKSNMKEKKKLFNANDDLERYMRRMELIAPCHFGLEAVLKREIIDLGYEISEVEDGRVTHLSEMRRLYAVQMCSCVRQSVFSLRWGALKQQALKSCLRQRRAFAGKNIFRETENSGLRKLLR